jgi:enediyne biosynthesis protein E7
MSAVTGPAAAKAETVPLHRVLPGLARDPLKALVGFANASGGAPVRLGLGTFRPFLVTNPPHVQRVLRDNAANYPRDGKGILWRPAKRLFGEGVLSEGAVWHASRRTLQPMFTAKRVDALGDGMAREVDAAVGDLERHGPDRALDIRSELSTVVCRVVVRLLFASKVSVADALRIVDAQNTIGAAVVPRMLAPFVPNAIPMPGDRAFRDAVQTIDDILLPVVRDARRRRDEGDDIVATLSRAPAADGGELDERQVRNDTVATFAAATETTYGVLTYLWPLLDANPAVAQRMTEEVDQVVGAGPVRQPHLRELVYTRMVLDELLRLHPVGWIIPRVAAGDDVIEGVRIPKGADIIISPYVTQRLDAVWDKPETFDPERFGRDRIERRHRYAHYPFGGGPHQCLGQHLFYLEALLIVAAILHRFRFRLVSAGMPTTQVGASLRPRERVELALTPRDRSPLR